MDIHGRDISTMDGEDIIQKRLLEEDFIQKTTSWRRLHPKTVFLDPGSLKNRFFGPRITEKKFFWTPDHWKSDFLDPGSMVYGPWSILAIIFPEKSPGVLFFTVHRCPPGIHPRIEGIERKRCQEPQIRPSLPRAGVFGWREFSTNSLKLYCGGVWLTYLQGK